MIKINDKEISYQPGMTVADAIKISGIPISSMFVVLVDGELIALDKLNETQLSVSSKIKLLMLLSGG